jgi:hypothetical protein
LIQVSDFPDALRSDLIRLPKQLWVEALDQIENKFFSIFRQLSVQTWKGNASGQIVVSTHGECFSTVLEQNLKNVCGTSTITRLKSQYIVNILYWVKRLLQKAPQIQNFRSALKSCADFHRDDLL